MSSSSSPGSKKNNNTQQWMKYAGMGAQIVVLLSISIIAGMWLDKKTGYSLPVFTIVLPLIAIIYFLYSIIKDLGQK